MNVRPAAADKQAVAERMASIPRGTRAPLVRFFRLGDGRAAKKSCLPAVAFAPLWLEGVFLG